MSATATQAAQYEAATIECAQQARAVLLATVSICGGDRMATYTALLGAAIATCVCCEEAAELLKVGEDMLAQARVQITNRRAAARTGRDP